jgi:2-dehydropantoate 2-reductase
VRFVVYGAGAIGGVVGGQLHAHDHDVLLIARGAHAEAIRSDGLVVETPESRFTVDVPVVTHPSEVEFGDDDVVLLATKSHQSEVAVRHLAANAPPTVPVVCMQNGVSNEREVLRRFARVQAMVVMCPGAHLEPGVVQAFSAPTTGLLDIGRYPEGVDEVTEAVAAALERSTFESRPLPDVMRWKYGKLMLNLLNAIEAACGITKELGPLIDAVRDEGRAALRAAGIDFVDDEEDRARRGDRLNMRPIDGERRGGGSSWQSLARGAGDIETDYLNGEIVLLGRLHGVPTPANALLQQVANELARAGAPPHSLTPAELLARYEG